MIHLFLNNMAAILADGNLRCIFSNANDRIPIWISLKSVSRSLIDYDPALIQVPDRRRDTIWTNADTIHWRIYAALGGGWDNLNYMTITAVIWNGLHNFVSHNSNWTPHATHILNWELICVVSRSKITQLKELFRLQNCMQNVLTYWPLTSFNWMVYLLFCQVKRLFINCL